VTLRAIDRRQLARGSAQRIIENVKAANIRGLGGGAFPTATKLLAAAQSSAVIINGLQSEPDNNVDITLLEQHCDSVVAGAALVCLTNPASELVVAVPAAHKAELQSTLVSALEKEMQWVNEVRGRTANQEGRPEATQLTARVAWLPVTHGSGEEHALARTLGLSDEPSVPGSEPPLTQQSLVCFNVATCHAIACAVFEGTPLTGRLVSINGTVRWVAFGTPVSDLLPNEPSVWMNGSHGGYPVTPTQQVEPGVFCVARAPAPPEAPCINCGACAPVCPSGLRPEELHRALELGDSPDPQQRLSDCIECGACNAVCPSGLWLARKANAEKAKARVKARNKRLADQLEQQSDQVRREQKNAGRRQW